MQPDDAADQDLEPSIGQRALRNLGLFLAAIAAVTVGGIVAGWLYAQGSPQRAARTVVSQFVEDEPNIGDVAPAADQAAPTSGAHAGTARCGRSPAAVGPADQLATLATGAVIVQYDPNHPVDTELLDELAARPDVLVAPNPALSHAVVATAWTRRMTLPDATGELLFAFVTGHAGVGPDAASPCPPLDGSVQAPSVG